MGQDIRKMFGNENEENRHSLPQGHQKRFSRKLDKALPQEKNQNYLWFKVAAIFIVALGVGMFFFLQQPETQTSVADAPNVETKANPSEENEKQNAFALSDISPEYKKVEDYYMASINVELSKLNITKENKALIDAFMLQLSGLDNEYKKLNLELAEAGINEQTIEALVDNLKLRVELLLKLKQKLKELNQIKNEKYEAING